LGHEERFPSPSLSGRCRLDEATFAGMGGKEEDAPIPATPEWDETVRCDPEVTSLEWQL